MQAVFLAAISLLASLAPLHALPVGEESSLLADTAEQYLTDGDITEDLADQNPSPGDVKSKKASAFNRRLLRAQDHAFSRRLLRAGPDYTSAFNRRLLRGGNEAYARRLIRSPSSYNRRILRSDSAFHRRLLRSPDSSFRRRLLRSAFHRRLIRSADPSYSFKRRILKKSDPTVAKRQSLIPFPRTGKRSAGLVESEPEILTPVYQSMDSYAYDQGGDEDEGLDEQFADDQDDAEDENGDDVPLDLEV